MKRRWPGKREATTYEIIFMADGAIPMSIVAKYLGAVRVAPDGAKLFPDVLLSLGFE